MAGLYQRWRYYPDVEKSGWLVDQVGCDHQIEYMDHAHDGSPYNMYDSAGNIHKAVPLTMRPPVNTVFKGFKGEAIPSNKAPGFYNTTNLYYGPNQ